MSEIAVVATEGMWTRNGNRYNPNTHARQSVLQPTGENRDLLYCYFAEDRGEKGYNALAEAAKTYKGNVTVILPDGTHRPLKTAIAPDNGPIDYYLWTADGTMERSDKNGVTNPVLKFLEPDWTGVIAMPGPDPTPGAVFAPVILPQSGDIHFELPWGVQIKPTIYGFGPDNELIMAAQVPTGTGRVSALWRLDQAGAKQVVSRKLGVYVNGIFVVGDEGTALTVSIGVNGKAGDYPVRINDGDVISFMTRNVGLREMGLATAVTTCDWYAGVYG